jgi:2-hydroxymuconate-semialdehyde hydrolase
VDRWPTGRPDSAADRLAALEDYVIERAGQAGVISANRALPLAIDVDEVRRIDVPVTLICGRHDRLAPIGHTRRVSAELGWPLAVIDDAGHLPHLEQPRMFAAALRSAIDPDHQPTHKEHQ